MPPKSFALSAWPVGAHTGGPGSPCVSINPRHVRVVTCYFLLPLQGLGKGQGGSPVPRGGSAAARQRAPLARMHFAPPASLCVLAVDGPQGSRSGPRLPGETGIPGPVRRLATEGEGLDEVARRALLALVSAPQVLLLDAACNSTLSTNVGYHTTRSSCGCERNTVHSDDSKDTIQAQFYNLVAQDIEHSVLKDCTRFDSVQFCVVFLARES
jgi:hypothetical protein